MRKLTMAASGVGLVAALWAGGWYAGSVFLVAPEADKAVEQLRDGRLFFSFDERRIGGFPLGYEVTYAEPKLSDSTSLWTWRAPWLAVEQGEAGGLLLTAAPESRLIVESAALGGEPDEPPVVFEIEAEAMQAALTGDGATGRAKIEAASWTATQKGAAGFLSGAQARFDALEADVAFGGDGALSGDIAADAASLSYRLSPDGGVTESRSSTSMDGLKVGFEADFRGAESLADFLAADGAARLDISANAYRGEGGNTGGPSSPPVTATFVGGVTAAEISVRDGRARYAGRAEGIDSTMLFEAPAPFPGGEMKLGAVDVAMEMPLKLTGETERYALTMELAVLEVGESLWGLFDPGALIERTPVEFGLALGGDARVLTDFRQQTPGQPPIDLETLEIDKLSLDALGVSARASGTLDIAGDAGRPDGAVTLSLTGALGLLDQLGTAGVFPPQIAEAYKALILQYAREVGEDQLEAEIVSRNGAVSINGQPLQQ